MEYLSRLCDVTEKKNVFVNPSTVDGDDEKKGKCVHEDSHLAHLPTVIVYSYVSVLSIN